MDQTTQQNAAPVEQAAAAARSMEEQVATLARNVARFRLRQSVQPARAEVIPIRTQEAKRSATGKGQPAIPGAV